MPDRNGNSLTEYPDPFGEARLVGITPDGVAAYHEDSEVFLAELENGRVEIPPGGFGPFHSVDLKGFEWTLGEYIVETAMDDGPWRALSDYGEYHINQVGQTTVGIVRNES